MSPRRIEQVRVSDTISRRTEKAHPFVVRWRLNGKAHSSSFGQLDGPNGARAFQARLRQAAIDENQWNPVSGLPPRLDSISSIDVATFCGTYVGENWARLSKKTRPIYAEAMAKLVLAATRASATKPKPNWYTALVTYYTGQSKKVGRDVVWYVAGSLPRDLEIWLGRNALAVSDLDQFVLERVDSALRIRPDGIPYAASTANRHVTYSKTFLRSAVNKGMLERLSWPEATSGAKTKSTTTKPKHKVKKPNPAMMRAIIDAVPNGTPASRRYQVMTAIGFYTGMRPSEITALRADDFELPETGLGKVTVERAAIDKNGTEPPKNARSYREVSVPERLVTMLREWIKNNNIGHGYLFLTANGTWPALQQWGKALHRAGDKDGWPSPLYPYELRRTYASNANKAGVSNARLATLMGHDIAVLMDRYLFDIEGSEAEAAAATNEYFEN